MIDSHAHLNMFDEHERTAAVARAQEAGVNTILVPSTGPEDLEAVAEMPSSSAGGVVAAVGFHPHEARLLDAVGKRRLEKALQFPGVVAVGEIGLDFYYDHSSRDEQRRALEWQLGLAVEAGLPVVLHHREAWQDFLAVIDGAGELRGVAHSFTEGADGVGEIVARGLVVGISGMVTFARADNVRDAAAAVPEGKLLVETDSPFLAPVPHRGRRNEPAYVRLVAEEVARIRGVEVEVLENQTDEAFEGLFRPRR